MVFLGSYFLYLIFYLSQKLKSINNIYKIAIFITYSWVFLINVLVLPHFHGNLRDSIFLALLIVRILIIIITIITNVEGKDFLIGSLKLRPAQSFVIGFLLLILTGALLLSLPVSVNEGESINFINSLFTSTSAVCVTGLIVVDTGTYFSTFGQIIILILIQLGGLGIMTFGSFLAILIGNKIPLYNKTSTLEIYDQSSFNTLKALIKTIIIGTFLIEIVGAVILFFSIDTTMFGGSLYEKSYFSIFHSISAFCNAGFSLNSDNLIRYTSNIGVNISIMSLIVLGGIGFPVMLNLRNYFRYIIKTRIRKRESENVIMKLQTKIVLTVTISLIFIGTLLFGIFEWNGVMEGGSTLVKIMQSFFHAITPRTAGFNTLDTGAFKEFTYLLLIILMFIGASSGSTGGGIKTTTFFVLFSTCGSVLRGNKKVKTFKNKINQNTIYRAIAILISYLSVVFIATFILLVTEKFNMLQILFEVISAIATVGLSTGITFDLSNIGKLIIVIVMFTGRIGVLTFLYVFVKPKPERGIEYPEGSLSIG